MSRRIRFWAVLGIVAILPVLTGADCGIRQALWYFDPCRTILTCPEDLDPFNFAFNPQFFGEMRPDYGLDPFCTIPGMCGQTTVTRAGGGAVGGGGNAKAIGGFGAN